MKIIIQDWIVEWFSNRNPKKPISLNSDYYGQGLVDSLGMLELITEIEQHFSVCFDDEDFKSPSFLTVEGLVSIIYTKIPRTTI